MIHRLEYWLQISSKLQKTSSQKSQSMSQDSIKNNTETHGDTVPRSTPTVANGTTLSSECECPARQNSGDPVDAASQPESFDEKMMAQPGMPGFPLLPASKGFHLTLTKILVNFPELLKSVGIVETQADAL